jgi:PAS domain S-box-containing protein
VEFSVHISDTLRAVLDATPFPVAIVDLQDDKIFFWSSSALSLFGHTAPTATEWYQIAYPDPDYRRDVVDRWKPALEIARRQSPLAITAGEYSVTCRDGSVRTCELYAAFVADYLVVTFNDITERKRAEEVLSGISGKLIEAQEQERTYVARELHDDINQRLALLSVNLEAVKQAVSSSPADVGQHIREARDIVSELARDIQALSHRLHSSKLEYLGLEAAAKSFCGELSAHNRAEVDFRAKDIPKNLSRDVSLCLFRVLQEALQNAAKHSGVKHFEVTLRKESDEIHLSVRDRWIGFDIENAPGSRGIGLTSMRERLKLVDGELSIVSRRGFGTSIQARVPLVPKMKAVHA